MVAIADDESVEFTTEKEVIFSAVRGLSSAILTFETKTGAIRCGHFHDAFSPSSNRVLEEQKSYGIVGVLDFSFKKYVISISQREIAALVKGKTIWRIKDVRPTLYFRKTNHIQTLDEEDHEKTILKHIKAMFTSGSFYFSVAMDVTSSRQSVAEMDMKAASSRNVDIRSISGRTAAEKVAANLKKDFDMMDERFVFNRLLLSSLYTLEFFPFIVPLIFGHISSTDFLLNNLTYTYAILSRCSNKRAGTRYFRGLDTYGSSAIEVETESLLLTQNRCLSFRQVRGSTPIIWKSSPPDELGEVLKIEVARDPAGLRTSENALYLHLTNLIERYGAPVTLVSLLKSHTVADRISRRKGKRPFCLLDPIGVAHGAEEQYARLAEAFESAFEKKLVELGEHQVGLVGFDEACLVQDPVKEMPKLMNLLLPALKKQCFLSTRVVEWNEVQLRAGRNVADGHSIIESKQSGVFRVNGIDCVDMTNVVQYHVAMEVLKNMLASIGVTDTLPPREAEKVKRLWVENGRALAYVSTGVSRVLYEEQISRSWFVFLFGRTAWYCIVRLGRLYMGTFRDSRRQEEFECMLGSTQHTIEDAIHLRKSLYALATKQQFGVALFLMMRQYFTPTHVNSVLNLVLAAMWLIGQVVVRYFVGNKAWSAGVLPRVGSKLDTSAIPERTDEAPRGLDHEISKRARLETKEMLNRSGRLGAPKIGSTSRKLSFS
ncbi:inositol polyphosphate 5-phosphatase [Chytriomyces hyalinus]|nr:inositol polyphosphate 5-phosphatase [Chytriomyces hyalinus]